MAIALKSGTLYFITEEDLFTGDRSGYYKIGLVKDVRQGDASTRLDEHQTGNPRQLVLHREVSAPAIEALESAMHARFAAERVRGEWFRLSTQQLSSAVTAAGRLSAQLEDALPALTAAEAVGTKKPKPNVARPKPEDIEWHRQAVAAKQLDDRFKKLKKGVDAAIRAVATDRKLVAGIGAFNKPGAPSVSKSKLTAVRPDLAAKYTTTSTSEGRSFTLLGASPKDVEVTLPKPFRSIESELWGLLETQRTSRQFLEQVHQSFLELLRYSAEASWRYDFAVAEIMASCGRHSGIDGVCTWPWKITPTTSFEATAFKNAHPELAEQCKTQPSPGFKVLPMRGYRASK